MTRTSKIQLRGHCQCCGREQAVVRGALMSKHGYTVEQGWFKGVCQGDRFSPVEHDRTQLDAIVAAVSKECDALDARALRVQTGSETPVQIEVSRRYNPVTRSSDPVVVAWADASLHQRAAAVRSMVWKLEQRARMGRAFAESLIKIADAYHGQSLVEVKSEDAPLPISCGEQRSGPAGVLLTARSIGRGKVVWISATGRRGSMSTRAWRLLPQGVQS